MRGSRKGANPSDKPKVAENPKPKTSGETEQQRRTEQKPEHNGAPGNRTEQRTNGQKGDQQNRTQEGRNDGPTEGEKTGERTVTGDKGQKITVDAQNRVTKLEYRNGLKVNLEYSGDSKDPSRAVVQGNGQDVVLVKNGNEYKVIDHGKPTNDTIQKIEIRKDGSAVLYGTRDMGAGIKIQGMKTVSTDGTTSDKVA